MSTRVIVSFLLSIAGLLMTFANARAGDLPVDYREKARVALKIPERQNPGSVVTFYQPAYATIKGGASRKDCVWAVRVDYTLADDEGRLPYSVTIAVVIFSEGGATEVVNLDRVHWTFGAPEPEGKKPA